MLSEWVDFHWEVDGKMYDFSMPGGGFVSLEHLVELLDINKGTEYSGSGTDSAENGAENADYKTVEESDLITASTYSAAELNALEISKETRQFVADVQSVEFSSPELVWVGKAEKDCTIGVLKAENGLEVEYSADLTEEEIAQINDSTVEAGDWALISMQPFAGEESLTVTMKNGDQWVVRVTDDQENPLGLDGKSFSILGTKNDSTCSLTNSTNNADTSWGGKVDYIRATPVSGSPSAATAWTFEWTKTGRKYLIHNADQYLVITGSKKDNGVLKLSSREEALENPIIVESLEGKYVLRNSEGNAVTLFGANKGFWVDEYKGAAASNYKDFLLTLQDPTNVKRPGTIATADTSGLITINLYNYGPEDKLDDVTNHIAGSNDPNANPYSQGLNSHALKFYSYGTEGNGINNFTGNSSVRSGIVADKLNDAHYPSLSTNGESLGYLFGAGDGNVTAYEGLNHLFTKDEAGYYHYDSDTNYAYYDTSGGNRDFKVYSKSFPEEGADNKSFGVGFFPFNDYDEYYNCIHGKNFGGWHGDDRDKEGHYDHHFGMEMIADFIYSPGGLYKGNPITYHFSGDDDMWVFIDDVLILDIGGIHNPASGDINFTTGEVRVNGTVQSETLKQKYKRVTGKDWDDSDWSQHEMRVFYMERGGMYSNLEVTFNLPLIPKGDVSFTKKDDSADGGKGLPGAEFTLYTDEACQNVLTSKSEPVKATSDSQGTVRFTDVLEGTYYMKETVTPAGYKANPTIYKVTIADRNSSRQSGIETPDGTPVMEIINEQNKITLSVNKTWLDADGNEILDTSGYSATFTAHRLKSYTATETAEVKPEAAAMLQIGYYYNEWTSGRWVTHYANYGEQIYQFKPGTAATVFYDYKDVHNNENYNYRRYKIGQNGRETQNAPDTGSITVTMPAAGQTVTVYLYDNWMRYGGYAFTSLTASGESPQVEQEVEHTDEPDEAFSRSLTLGNGVLRGTFEGTFPVQETIDGVIYTYRYYITENPKEGFTSTSGGHYSTDEDFTETFVNRKKPHPTPMDVDVDEQPRHHKSLTPNYAKDTTGAYVLDEEGNKKWDGTYTLSLDVTGKAASAQESSVNKADIILVLDMSSSMNDATTGGTRFEVEKSAVKSFGTKLLALNEKDADEVRMTVMTFGNKANEPMIRQTGSPQTFTAAIDGMSAPPVGTGGPSNGGQGTNWEDALQKANALPTREGAQVFVIFVSDGAPTLRNTPDNPHNFEAFMYKQVGAYGLGVDTTEGTMFTNQELVDSCVLKCYDNAKDDAKKIVDSGKQFYSISVFDAVNRMETLAAYAYSGSDSGQYPADHYKTAADASGLESVFSQIYQTASKSVDFRNVTITDPMTAAAKTTASIGEGTPVDFRYYKVTVDSEGSETAEEWVGGPKAKYTGNGAGGSIEWDVSAQKDDAGNDLANPLKNGALEKDVTYRVSFTVWPNQNAYDAAMRLKEADGDPEKISAILKAYPDVAASIVKDGDGKYTIYSNGEDAKVSYTQYVDNEPKQRGELYYNRPVMETLQHVMKVAKVWNDSIDPDNRLSKVRFEIYEDYQPNGENMPYKTIILDKTNASAADPNRWEATIPVSPAIRSDAIAQNKKLNQGHVYTVKEYIWQEGTDGSEGSWVSSDTDSHYEFNPENVTPILANGDMNYEGDANGDEALTGVNDVRGSLTIIKEILDENGNPVTEKLPEDEFTFKITLKNPGTKGEEITGKTAADADAIWYNKFGADGQQIGSAAVINSQDTFTLKAGQRLRLINVPAGLKYKVEEVSSSIPAGYLYDSTAYTYKTGSEGTEQGQTADSESYYTISANTWHFVTISNKVSKYTGFSFSKVWAKESAGLNPVPADGLKTWESGNTIHVTIKRIAQDAQAADTSFSLSYEIGSGNGPFMPVNTDLSDVDKTKYQLTKAVSTDQKRTTFTMDMVLEKLNADGKPYTYYVEETSASGNTLYNTYYGKLSDGGVSRTQGATYAKDGEVIINQEYCGYELPSTGGSGTGRLYLFGLMLIACAGAGLVMKRRRKAV